MVRVIGAIIAMFSTILLVVAFSVGLDRVVRPFQEETRRQTLEESRAHVNAAVDDIARYRLEWKKAPPSRKDELEMLILRKARDIDRDELPPRLRPFVDSLRQAD